MFDAIRKLGAHVIENDRLSEETVFIQESKLADTKKVICMVFELKGSKLTYSGAHLEEYDSARARGYLYRTFSHGHYDVTPTTRILSPGNLKKRTLLWFKEYSEKYNDWLIRSLDNEINRKQDEIFRDITNEFELLDKKEKNLIFTLKIKEGGKDKYLADYPIFRRILIEESLSKFFAKHNVVSKSIGVCYLCGEVKEVLGFASPFSFYTLDKQGFAPDFIRKNSWKRLPICSKCAISLEVGKEFLSKYLLKNFYGFKFYIIPKFTSGIISEDVIEYVKDIGDKKKAESLLSVEEDILMGLVGNRNAPNLDFMFIELKQKDFFNIVRYVEDVSPSWIKKMYDALEEVKNDPIFKESQLKNIAGKNWVGSLNSDITIGGLIRQFFPRPSYNKYFIDMVSDILSQKTIDKSLLFQAFIREIQSRHANEKVLEEKILCLKSFMLLMFLNKLKLIR